MNLEDIKKLTVADLKKELKTRNLSVTGNKSELTQRLSEHLLSNDEGQILEHSGVDESLLEGVHEDEVLGLSSDKFLDADLTPPATAKVTSLDTERKLTSPKVDDVGTAGTLKSKASVDLAKEPQSTEPKKVTLKSTSNKDETSKEQFAAISTSPALDPDQQKIERAKKFNLPLTEADRKKLRAERFAMSSGAKTTSTGGGTSLNADVLLKRSQRFGMPIVKTSKADPMTKGEDTEKLKQRAERFGLPNKGTEKANGNASSQSSGVESEQLLKRKLRFGGGVAGGGSNVEAVTKKKARAERFGLMNK